FIIIFTSFLFLNFITWNINIITAGTAGLLGISVVAAVGSAAINDSTQTADDTSDTVDKYKESVNKRLYDLRKDTSGNPTTFAISEATTREIVDLKRLIRTEVGEDLILKRKLMLSKNLYYDLLYDVNGGGLNRVQIIIWTIILGAMFLWTV